MTDARFDVIVAGLGAMGGAAAHHLARRGLRVLGFDRYAPPHALGSSHGRTRIIREAYFEHPVYVPLVQRAFALWRELEAEAGRALLRTTGALMLGRPDSQAVRGTLRSAEEHGLPYERLSAAELRERFPALRPAPETVGILEPRAGALDVEAAVRAHLDAAHGHGARLRFDEPVVDWGAAGGGAWVRTPAGRYHADALVLAAGAWMTELAPTLPLSVRRQVQLWFRPAREPDRLRPGAFPVFLWELAPERVFYGLPDLGDGVKVARHHGGAPVAALAGVRRDVDPGDVAEVRGFLRQCIPAADGALLEASVCLYTNTPDGHFLIDRHPQHARVWLVSACSGHGFKFAPVVGEQIAAGVTTGRIAPELAPFRLARLTA